MSYRLFQILVLLGFCIINSFEWDFLFNLDENDKLLCYSCKGIECEQITTNDENKIICNKKTQLCWAGFINQQPYRTCASRYCTPSDISLDSDIHIETCCRSNLCNSISLSWSTLGKSYKSISSSHRIETSTTITQTTTIDYFVEEIIDEKPSVSIDKDLYNNEESIPLSKSQLNRSNSNSFGVIWDLLPYDKDFSNRVASISSILLYLIPLLLVLLF